MAAAYVGTSGWQYDRWKGDWYKNVKRKDWLPYSSSVFTSLEADGTFYGQQKRETYVAWANRTPANFKFAIRGHRWITHRKRLKDVAESVQTLKTQADGLGEKLGCVLWQLPPNFHRNEDRLKAFLQVLQSWGNTRHAFEFRHESWFVDSVATLLHQYHISNVISHSGKWKQWDAITTDLVYVRLHGAPYTYASDYGPGELDIWAGKCRDWLTENRDVYVFFDNDYHGFAPWNAQALLERLGHFERTSSTIRRIV